MKARHLLMSVGLLVAAGLLLLADDAPDADLAQPVHRLSQAAPDSPRSSMNGDVDHAQDSSVSRTARKENGIQILVLRPRAELISAGAGRRDGLFASRPWGAAIQAKSSPPPPPPPPSAPPLPFAYLGKQVSVGQIEVYLTQGDRVIVAHEHTVIDGTYRIDSIRPPMMVLTYLPLKQTQQLAIGVSE